MRWVKKTGVILFRLRFSTDSSSRKSQVFRLDPPVGKLSGKTLSRKSPFLTVLDSPIWASVENGRFRLINSTA